MTETSNLYFHLFVYNLDNKHKTIFWANIQSPQRQTQDVSNVLYYSLLEK